MRQAWNPVGAAIFATALLALVSSLCLAPPREPERPKLPRVTSRPAAERDAVLKKIEQRAKDVKSVAADFLQDIHRPVFDERDTRTGSLKMLKPQYFRVDWQTPEPEGIVYDGEFFWEIKNGVKQVIQWTVSKKEPADKDKDEQAPGQGKPRLDFGPFRFLGGVKADELKTDYLIALIDTPKDDKTHRLLLVPLKPEERVDFTRLDVWIDRKELLPVKIRFTRPNKEVETWTLKALKVNKDVTKEAFRVRVPRGWKLIKDPAGAP